MRTLRSLMTLICALAMTLMLTGCGSDAGGDAASVGATGLTVKEITIDESSVVTLTSIPRYKPSLMDFIMPQALAALFVDMEPYFAPYYQKILLSGSDATAIKKEIAIFPRIAVDSVGDDGDDENGFVYLVDQIDGSNVFYHFVVQRTGGAVAYGQQGLTIKILDTNDDEETDGATCYVTIANADTSSLSNGDIILETRDYAGDDGSLISNLGCKLQIEGSLNGIAFVKLVALKGIKDNHANEDQYPIMESVSFDGEDVSTNEITIDYTEIEEKSNGYRYGDWAITQPAGLHANYTIVQTYWMFTCGGGGQSSWVSSANIATHASVSANSYEAAYDGVYATDASKYPWRVGGCEEMLMMVSAVDTNGIMSQKKIAITAQ